MRKAEANGFKRYRTWEAEKHVEIAAESSGHFR